MTKFPCIVSPKLQGFKCRIINGVAMYVDGNPIQNRHVQEILGGQPSLEGVLVVGPPTAPGVLETTCAAITEPEGHPEFVFFVHDVVIKDPLPFADRNDLACSWAAAVGNPAVRWLPQRVVNGFAEMKLAQDQLHAEGYGIVIRDPEGLYDDE